jgi:hypothetical protein
MTSEGELARLSLEYDGQLQRETFLRQQLCRLAREYEDLLRGTPGHQPVETAHGIPVLGVYDRLDAVAVLTDSVSVPPIWHDRPATFK